jgi:hypothetical protein
MVTLSGETWSVEMTDEEWQEYDKYANAHPWLISGIGDGAIANMFLSHFRRGINLNKKV